MTNLSYVRSLARIGASERAWAAFKAAGYDQATGDTALLCLKGRLVKDRAMLSAGAERSQLLRAAAEAYGAAASLGRDTYSRINAATLVYLRGDHATAAALATDLLALIDSGEHEPETPYWLLATRAEALLLTGRIGDAQRALTEAIAAAPQAREDRAATLRQFRRILAEADADDAWLTPLAVAAVLHFRGAIGISDGDEATILNAVTASRPGTAFGALAAGADIVAAEAALACGAELHVILPATVPVFKSASVSPMGAQWDQRFDAVLAQTTHVEIIAEADALSEAAMALGERIAVGRAVAEARVSGAALTMLEAISPKAAVPEPGPFAHDQRVLRLVCSAGIVPPPLPPPEALSVWIARPGEAAVQPTSLADAAPLLDDLPAGSVVDISTADAGDGEPQPFAALRRLERDSAIIATRPAALVLTTLHAACRTVLAGEAESGEGSVEFYDIVIGDGITP